MILIGQFDSPFVRRVGVAMTLYEIPFEHRPWSTFGDGEKIRPYNPLMRVPTLVLDNGEALIESHAILDYLDGGVPAVKRMFPVADPNRYQALKVAALATGMADKLVSLLYEKRLHAEASEVWIERCRTQISGVLSALEKDRAGRASVYWFGERIGHADVAAACALRFLGEAHAGLIDMAGFPALAAHAERLEATPAFRKISQPFIPPR